MGEGVGVGAGVFVVVRITGCVTRVVIVIPSQRGFASCYVGSSACWPACLPAMPALPTASAKTLHKEGGGEVEGVSADHAHGVYSLQEGCNRTLSYQKQQATVSATWSPCCLLCVPWYLGGTLVAWCTCASGCAIQSSSCRVLPSAGPCRLYVAVLYGVLRLAG